MTILVLNEEQTQLVRRAKEPVEVRDASGRVLTTIDPPAGPAAAERYEIPNEAELIATALRFRGSNQPTYTSEQVQAHLGALEKEAARGATRDELLAFSERLRREADAG